MKNKAQSEMVGFAIIIVLVAVIILVFLSISMNKPTQNYVESKESANFLNAMLDYTTECEASYANYLSLKKLIDRCMEGKTCMEDDPCEIFNETMEELLSSSWKVGPEWPTKGYKLDIIKEGEKFASFQEGNITRESRGASQSYDGGLDFLFIAYY